MYHSFVVRTKCLSLASNHWGFTVEPLTALEGRVLLLEVKTWKPWLLVMIVMVFYQQKTLSVLRKMGTWRNHLTLVFFKKLSLLSSFEFISYRSTTWFIDTNRDGVGNYSCWELLPASCWVAWMLLNVPYYEETWRLRIKHCVPRNSRTVYILSKNAYFSHFKIGGLLVLEKKNVHTPHTKEYRLWNSAFLRGSIPNFLSTPQSNYLNYVYFIFWVHAFAISYVRHFSFI